ncbi:hypothetical protein [Granulicatella seriolae]|uniref:Uncharacterized protein n=1 Tax=Granulicatella seriolae TaxID=2967226 RepID=A0ABT1WP88_9LACT|nr:hypothetical protein [Granulicatella seriolae]
MSNEERIYCMEDGRIVSLVASYKDYFSDEMFVVLIWLLCKREYWYYHI